MFKNILIVILLLGTLMSANYSFNNGFSKSGEAEELLNLDGLNYYEVNIRNFTQEGKISGLITHLPRLKKMGVDVLCLLPVYSIGEKNRKGEMGDPYFIRDYTTVNGQLGTSEDLKLLVKSAHEQGLKITLDWDAYKMSPDNKWRKKKNWFKSISDEKYVFPDYENDDLCDAMRDAMMTWVKDYNIDGFRCFNTDKIPLCYWDGTWEMLNAQKSLISIATNDDKKFLDNGFNVLYSSGLYEILKAVITGDKNGRQIEDYIKAHAGEKNSGGHYLNYISNHFENTYNGPLRDRIGNATKILSILTIMLDGNPLLFNGQEAGLGKSLSCCDKDEIKWYSYIRGSLFTTLLQLRHENEAMKEGSLGGRFERIQCTDNGGVLAFQRTKGKDRVVVLMNLSDRRRLFKFTEQLPTDLPMFDLFTGEAVDLSMWNGKYKDLDIWGYHIYVTK